MIKKVELGNTGKMISQYALGCMLMGTVINTQDSYKILDDYILIKDGNFIDTANNYAWWIGNGQYSGIESETLLGQWIKERNVRDQIILATKVGARLKDHMAIRDKNGIPRWDEIPENFEGASREVILSNLKDSLARLQTDYIDLYYIHVDDRQTPLEETLSTMNKLIEDGQIKYYGYSNIQTWRLEQVYNLCEQNDWHKPVAIQQEYSYINPAKYKAYPYEVHSKEEFFDWLSVKGDISLVAYSPLLKGIYGNRSKAEALLENPEYDSRVTRDRLQKITKVASKYKISPNALVLAILANSNDRIIPILGFSKIEHYMENITCLAIDIESIKSDL